jgi:hypothetical protein
MAPKGQNMYDHINNWMIYITFVYAGWLAIPRLPSDFRTIMVYVFLIFPMRVTCAHLILHLITLIIFGE